MRIGYNLAISTAVAAVSLAGFAAAAQFGHLHQHHAVTGKPGRPSTHWKKETIVRLGPVAKRGLVAEGIETGDNRTATWKIRVLPRHNMVTGQLTGSGVWYIGNLKKSVNPGAIGTFYNAATNGWPGVYGVVSNDVTRVAVTVGKHQTLNLYPVAAAGRRWVALLTPPGSARPTTFTAYSGKTELAHGINSAVGPVTWLLPGQHGLAKQARSLGGGKISARSGQELTWSLEAQAGPWGYDLMLNSQLGHNVFIGIYSMSPDTAKSAGVKQIANAGSPRLARWVLGTAKPSVAYLKFDLAGRKALRASAVLLEGQRFFGLPLAHGPKVTSWAAYDKAGHKLYGGTGLPEDRSVCRAAGGHRLGRQYPLSAGHQGLPEALSVILLGLV